MLSDQLRSSPLFADLTDSQLERAAGLMQEKDVVVGTVLARQGDFAYHLFVVLEGTAAVTVDDEPVTVLQPGDTFGEIGVLERGRRTASVVASGPMRLLTMTVWEFNKLAEELPELAARATALAKARLEHTQT
jgi:CRP/FNR family transcriptional regulator, cyclic AMP receptor protein